MTRTAAIVLGVCAALAATGMTAGTRATAQPAAEFYRGQQVRIVVGSTVGSGYDRWARLLARHLGRHIPGGPTVTVENMPGAGSLVAANHLFNTATRDGTVLGMVSRSMPSAGVMQVKNVRFDPVKFQWIGSPEANHLVLYINNSSRIKTLADLFEQPLVVGATGRAQGITIGPALLRNLVGMKFSIKTGYRSTADLSRAAGRGDIDAFANTVASAAGARRPWVESGQMRALFNFEEDRVPGLDAPSVFDVLKTDEQRRVLTFFGGNVLLGRPLLMPPDAPRDRVSALRQALGQTVRDPAFLKEAAAASFDVTFQSGDRIASMVKLIASTPADVIAKATQSSQTE